MPPAGTLAFCATPEEAGKSYLADFSLEHCESVTHTGLGEPSAIDLKVKSYLSADLQTKLLTTHQQSGLPTNLLNQLAQLLLY